MPYARVTVVPHAGHDVNTHAPAAFTSALLDFLTELRPPRTASVAVVA